MCAALGVILMRCLECNYNLIGLKSQVCPECGAAFDPSDPATYRPAVVPRELRHLALGLTLIAIVADAIAFGFGMSDDGAGWAFNFPCLFTNGCLTPIIALTAVIIAVIHLRRRSWHDVIAWIVLILAIAAGIGALRMLNRSFWEIMSV